MQARKLLRVIENEGPRRPPQLNAGDKLNIGGAEVTVIGKHSHSMMLSPKYRTTLGPIFFNPRSDQWEFYKVEPGG
jgi:hypothetical protein